VSERAPPDVRHAGGCRCGRVRFRASADPIFTSYCHCRDCRKASGAPVLAFVGFCRDDVTFEAAGEKDYGDSPARRSFCPECGTPIAYRDDRLADRIYFVLGAMDAPQCYPPTHHAFLCEALDFPAIEDSLPRYQRFSVERP